MNYLLDQNGLTESEFLASYNPGDYPRPSVAADIVIFTVADAPRDNYRKLAEKELRVLLIRRGGHPFLGQWALPGGFVRPDETIDTAARRELLEETGVTSGYLEQLYTFSDPGRDPRTWVISCAHMALLDSTALELEAGDDAADAWWFNVSCTQEGEAQRLTLTADDATLSALVAPQGGSWTVLENNGLAFDHPKILITALLRLREKLEQTDLALNLMGETFTLTQLQQVYEVIWGRPLLKAAFRRKVQHMVEETGTYTENAGHRPSQLFRRAAPINS